MISAIYLINAKGDIILYRKYRDDVARNAAENFRLHVIRDKNNDVAPITTHNKCFFFHIRVEDLCVPQKLTVPSADLVFQTQLFSTSCSGGPAYECHVAQYIQWTYRKDV